MKLLLDQNLSHRVLERLPDELSESVHVRDVGLEEASDLEVWRFARVNGFTIISKDSDFRQLALVSGAPPKVVWISRGNCTTDELIDTIERHTSALVRFARDEEAAFLEIG